MVFGVYCIRDLKSTFMTPTYDMNDQVAVRNFAHAVTQTDGVLHSHKQDFELYKLGEYDNEAGVINMFDVRELLCEGKDF